MMALLRREGSIHAIDGKYPDGTSNSDKDKIEGDALSVIKLSLAPNVLCKCDIENSMMYSKEPISLEQVRQAFNSCDVWRHFEGDKDDEARSENNEQVDLNKEKDQETQVDESKDAELEEFVVNESYTIAKGRDKRQIQRSERLIEQANLITYVFVAAEEEIKDLEPSLYVEATSCKGSIQ
ncbi:hypothetical protein HAX54_031060 [Datura stramonium]|uniref:Uncharacterized protein n=1 Tax=Datura stramonium TaxID=4076 RepID=A0ABS8VBC8_DATST|nr:hypothetical protein [Datura stramonium]